MQPMLMYPHIDPVALQLGPVAIHWYGLTYLAAFGLFLWLGTRRLKHPPFNRLQGEQAWVRRDIEDLLFYGVVGVILGGRLGYCLFYKPAYYLSHPLEVFAVWEGGMSFHGGLLGVIAAMVFFASTRKRPLLLVMDFVAPCVATGWQQDALATSSMVNSGGALPALICPGPWCFRKAAPCCRATLADLSVSAGRSAAVRAAVDLCQKRAQARSGCSSLCLRVWRVPLYCRVFP